MFEIQPGDIQTTPPTPPVPNFNWTITLQSLYSKLTQSLNVSDCIWLVKIQQENFTWGHFRVAPSLRFKARLIANPLICECLSILMQIIFRSKALHLA